MVTTTLPPKAKWRGNPASADHLPNPNDLVTYDDEIAAAVTALEARDFTAPNPKEPVACATTANITLSGEQTIDGVLTSTARVLVKNQTDASENGIYVSASGVWARATDMDADAEVDWATVYVGAGTVNIGTTWSAGVSSITLGTDAIPWVQIGSASGLEAQLDTATSDISDLTAQSNGVFTPTNQIFDKDDPDYTVGRYINYLTGATSGNAIYDCTGYCAVVAGNPYYIKGNPAAGNRAYAWYDASKVFISGFNFGPLSVTAPAGAAFLRATLSTGESASFYIVDGATEPEYAEPYGGKVTTDHVFDLPTRALADSAVTPEKIGALTQTKNLFDKSDITPDARMNNLGTEVVDVTYALSGHIYLEPGVTYALSGDTGAAIQHTAFDADGGVVSGEGGNTEITSLTVPINGVRSYRFSIFTHDIDSFQVEVGAAATSYYKYGFVFDPDIYMGNIPDGVSPWKDKLWTSYGDSVTFQNLWQPYVAADLILAHTNLGTNAQLISGAAGLCQDAAINAIALDCDVLTVFGGVNDWGNEVVLGLEGSTDTDEFYGALNQMAEKLVTRLPACRIFWMTPIFAGVVDSLVARGWPDAYTNMAGLTTRDYAEAIRVIAKKWGIPIIDVNAEEGVNTVNIADYRLYGVGTDTDNYHPNDAGGQRIASVVNGRLRAIEPMA